MTIVTNKELKEYKSRLDEDERTLTSKEIADILDSHITLSEAGTSLLKEHDRWRGEVQQWSEDTDSLLVTGRDALRHVAEMIEMWYPEPGDKSAVLRELADKMDRKLASQSERDERDRLTEFYDCPCELFRKVDEDA